MKCPSCRETTLLISNRADVEIDYCPECRGVWLDRGELDKIIERSDRHERETNVPRPVTDLGRRDRDRDDDDDDDDRHGGQFGKKRKRKGFLSEIFEFGE